MSLTDYAEDALLSLLFTNDNWANVGDATGLQGASTAGSWHIALWVGNPTDAGTSGTEAAYTDYARVAVARSTAGWTVSGTSPTEVTNDLAITFPAAGSSGSTITHFAIMDAATSGNMIAHAALNDSLTITTGVVPRFAGGALTLTLD